MAFKNIVTTAFFLLFFSQLYSQKDHVIEISALAYLSQLDNLEAPIADQRRSCLAGAGIQFKHYVATLPAFGSRAEVTFDTESDLTISFSAFVARIGIFKKLMTVELIAPTFVFKIERKISLRPFGIGLEIGRQKCRIYITELMTTDLTFETRVAFKYIFY